MALGGSRISDGSCRCFPTFPACSTASASLDWRLGAATGWAWNIGEGVGYGGSLPGPPWGGPCVALREQQSRPLSGTRLRLYAPETGSDAAGPHPGSVRS